MCSLETELRDKMLEEDKSSPPSPRRLLHQAVELSRLFVLHFVQSPGHCSCSRGVRKLKLSNGANSLRAAKWDC